MPWKNSWFQLTLFAAVVSGVFLAMDSGPFFLRMASAIPPVASSGPPVAGHDWTDSLGLVFKPVPGLEKVLVCESDTRVEDFTAFVNATGFQATAGMMTWDAKTANYQDQGNTRQNPGFSQTDNDPVVGVSWNDAMDFCKWLTTKEQKAGMLTGNQSYRLPTGDEWTAAAGPGEYPWGTLWPPPPAAGNFAGTESKLPQAIPDYDDGYPRTSPVRSFKPNAYGLYDIEGNVYQWCMDSGNGTNFDSGEKLICGSGWNSGDSHEVQLSYHTDSIPENRNDNTGFRMVVVVSQ
jgi:formylglycine-generating enzyme required for sulfatase activity